MVLARLWAGHFVVSSVTTRCLTVNVFKDEEGTLFSYKTNIKLSFYTVMVYETKAQYFDVWLYWNITQNHS